MQDTLTTEVLIVGAGPTGLMAANQLARFGIDFIVVDKKEGPTTESRAIAITARSLEIYQQMGLAEKAVEEGKIMNSFHLFFRGKQRAEVKIGEIGKGLSEFSYMLAFEQSKNEVLLANNLISNGQKVLWEHEFIELTDYQKDINALVKTRIGITNIKAQYLIASDGASSPVRQQLDFSFKGGTYDHKFFVADATVKWDLGYHKLILCPGERNFCAFLPLKSDQTYRIIGTLPERYADQEEISFQDIEDTVKHTLNLEVIFESVNWFSTYRLHHRSVDHFSRGRVFLAGDSAHIHSPAGGQGMNTGLQDAYNLSWKMALVLKKQAKLRLLETYNEERLPFARWLLRFTDRGFNLMTSSNWFIRLFRRYVVLNLVGKILSSPTIRPLIFRTVSQTGYSYRGRRLSQSSEVEGLLFKSGDRLPYFDEGNLYSKLQAPAFHMLHVGQFPLNSDTSANLKALFPFDIRVVDEPLNGRWQDLGVREEVFILLRPDNYIAGVYPTFGADTAEKWLMECFD